MTFVALSDSLATGYSPLVFENQISDEADNAWLEGEAWIVT